MSNSSNDTVSGSVPQLNTQVENSDVDQTSLRYAAYANRFRTILQASHRYVAYTSDIGESFRPVAHPFIVTIGYSISWLYILGDVSYASWKVKMKSEGRYTNNLMPWNYPYPEPNDTAKVLYEQKSESLVEQDWRLAFVKRGLFQSIASMGLPAWTIHNAVRYSSIMFKESKSKPLKTYGPVAVGLGIVPLLPYVFDEPVEYVIDYVFDKGEDFYKKSQKLE
ncbi:hypothetical protein PSN45_001099 [Yamadazyma tenuis]|uniref:Mitochondrial fission process protein 1 n=1 Tax=Candida tenuis (strain ATCC 10573 / BCRC 21748 / CBS 615 / JCM 9827 / NBRC 10315 / NRRL Y-1498 / VKM Y-70) TaxID=590646 RepID=G3B8C7_CANTC|nr:uncharacterized protein CANTEDRAFT_109227 [Yamadazyma tenuis ATCC 10573]EGV62365.1 hypothetical protein CANTEDRAFT_109227 [Yamadazyma tenuis ATCC 10573]WEJ93630.1 hypothetical protein PSN45_001099 [Yamadazyma tenuis]